MLVGIKPVHHGMSITDCEIKKLESCTATRRDLSSSQSAATPARDELKNRRTPLYVHAFGIKKVAHRCQGRWADSVVSPAILPRIRQSGGTYEIGAGQRNK